MEARFLDHNRAPNGNHKVMIALNLHSSQAVLPALSAAILNALRYLGTENVFLSIYENGSWDHTPEGLGHLGAVLTGLGVRHRFRSAKEDTSWAGVDRIKILSEYRNMALSAIDQAHHALGRLSDLVFINDVFLCTQDILEVIWQRKFQKADASCGTDWRESQKITDRLGWSTKKPEEEEETEGDQGPRREGNHSVVLYDSWVARSLTGKTLRPRLDFLSDYRDGYGVIFDREPAPVFQARFQNAQPVPVYSCWNGIVALDPRPFAGPMKISFRAADRPSGECPSSECQLLAKDFWSLGFDRWILVPKVAVTYAQDIYYSHALVRGSNRDHRPPAVPPPRDELEHSNELIDWSKYQKPETVVCWPDMHVFHLDFEWNHVLESPYNPKLRALSTPPSTSFTRA